MVEVMKKCHSELDSESTRKQTLKQVQGDGLEYQKDIENVLSLNCDFSVLNNRTILITGATGLIGSVLADMLVFLSEKFNLALNLILVSRSVENHSEKKNNAALTFIKCDISNENILEKIEEIASPSARNDSVSNLGNKKIDCIFHLSSTTHPKAYSKYPIETILTNVNGTHQLLELASKNLPCRFVLASSVEVYGDDRQNLADGFSETDFGYLDPNTARACYNEAKRLSETLCQAYKAEKNCDVVIARLARSYGPTLKKDDSKALSQFIHRGLSGENIVLKSDGNQFYSYIYSADAAGALVFLMLKGGNREAYNIADRNSNIYLKDLASLVAKNCGVKVVFDIPDEAEKNGYSKAVRAVLNPAKLNLLGWKAQVGIGDGIKRTVEIMRGGGKK